jgi:hypothetical protein
MLIVFDVSRVLYSSPREASRGAAGLTGGEASPADSAPLDSARGGFPTDSAGAFRVSWLLQLLYP